jgi:hypothetical protein
MLDPLLVDETSCEEEAAWLAAVEAQHDEAQAFVRRVTALARGYVLAEQQGRGDLAVADVMGGFALDRRSAENALGEALLFVSHPATLSALDERRVGLRHARALMDVLENLPPELADQVEERVLAALTARPGRPPARVRDLARREALRLDKDAAVRRREAAARTRHLHLRDAGDGMVELVLLMRAEHGLAVLHRAEQATRDDDGSGRTRDQRRLDWAVGQLLHDDQPAAAGSRGAAAEPATPGSSLVLDGRRRRPVQVLVHVPVVTALGLDDEPCDLRRSAPSTPSTAGCCSPWPSCARSASTRPPAGSSTSTTPSCAPSPTSSGCTSSAAQHARRSRPLPRRCGRHCSTWSRPRPSCPSSRRAGTAPPQRSAAPCGCATRAATS